MKQNELEKILKDHKTWLDSDAVEGSRANLVGADLIRANLRGANLIRANLIRADLREANLEGANLVGAYLREANLEGANLVGAYLREANLREADLREADLREADLRRADLREADLRRADLVGAYLREADLREADLREADLDYEIQEGLLLKIRDEVLSSPESLDMESWHSGCGTAHCLAGWACALNPRAKELEDKLGTQIAGLLTLGAEAHSMFFKSNEDVLEWLKSK